MWRYIFMTFAFLGWSFYTLSGGADYQPREGSRQAEAIKALAAAELRLSEAPAAQSTPKPNNPEEAIQNVINVTALAPSVILPPQPIRVLAPDPAPTTQVHTAAHDGRIANLSLAQPAAFAQAAGYAASSTETAPQDIRDLRRITGSSVNMRTGPGTSFGIMNRVTRDTQVEVLEQFENGWLRLRVLDSNRIGWVSAKLVSADQG